MNATLTFADGTVLSVSGVSDMDGQCKVFPTEEKTILEYVQLFSDPDKTKNLIYDLHMEGVDPVEFIGYTALTAMTASVANKFYYFVLEVTE